MGIEFFERAAEAGSQLLAVASKASESGGPDSLALLLLTFDVGRLLVRPEPRRADFRIEVIAAGAPLPGGLVDAGEHEPWWRVLGSPLARAWVPEGVLAAGVCLQFRADAESPRIVSLTARAASVFVRLENPPG